MARVTLEQSRGFEGNGKKKKKVEACSREGTSISSQRYGCQLERNLAGGRLFLAVVERPTQTLFGIRGGKSEKALRPQLELEAFLLWSGESSYEGKAEGKKNWPPNSPLSSGIIEEYQLPSYTLGIGSWKPCRRAGLKANNQSKKKKQLRRKRSWEGRKEEKGPRREIMFLSTRHTGARRSFVEMTLNSQGKA